MPEAWPGRVRALSTQPLPREWRLWASRGGGGEGRSVLGASLSSSTQGGGSECRGPAAVLFMVPGAAASSTRRGWDCGGQQGCSAVSVMRSQERGRGGPRQSLERVGRSGRKVLHVWVSGRGQGRGLGGWERPWSHGWGPAQSRGCGPRRRADGHPDVPLAGCGERPCPLSQEAPSRPIPEVQVRTQVRQDRDSAKVCWQGPELGTYAGQSPASPQPGCLLGGPQGPRRAAGQVGGRGAGLLEWTPCKRRLLRRPGCTLCSQQAGRGVRPSP